MMEEDLISGLPYDTIEVDGHKQQSVPAFNKAIAVTVLSSSTLVSTIKKPLNTSNSNNAMAMFLFSVIELGLLSLSVLVTMANAQTSSSSSTSGTDSTGNKNGVKEMGICVAGQGGPCNGDSNWDDTHDVTGKCVLLNGCSNNHNGNSNNFNNKNMNNNANVK
jgi:hypothetical protein